VSGQFVSGHIERLALVIKKENLKEWFIVGVKRTPPLASPPLAPPPAPLLAPPPALLPVPLAAPLLMSFPGAILWYTV
jgi:hypothetical protein